MPNKILIVNDIPVFREGLKAQLLKAPNMKVIGETDNCKAAVVQAIRLEPDLILMDLTIPLVLGTETIRLLKQYNPEFKILALTAPDSRGSIKEIIAAGANGCLHKQDVATKLISAIKSVLNGQVYLGPGIGDKDVDGGSRLQRKYQ